LKIIFLGANSVLGNASRMRRGRERPLAAECYRSALSIGAVDWTLVVVVCRKQQKQKTRVALLPVRLFSAVRCSPRFAYCQTAKW